MIATSEYSTLKPTDWMGALVFTGCVSASGLAVYLSMSDHLAIWLAGQLLLAMAILQWFVLIHEAGHKTLFKQRVLNKMSGHVASILAGIPFECWVLVHAAHHRWTGWQDLDATTATLVSRPLRLWEKLIINTSWRLWIPLFSILYRLQNYWNLVRLRRLFPKSHRTTKCVANALALLIFYAAVGYWIGPEQLLKLFGLAAYLSLMMQDVIILSQHTHIPMELSQGQKVSPFSPKEQELFTRSLKFPKWFSRLVLLNLDAHELHHMYASVPGYYLHRINYKTHNEVAWWRWLWKAKQVPAAVLLFQNSKQSGFDI